MKWKTLIFTFLAALLVTNESSAKLKQGEQRVTCTRNIDSVRLFDCTYDGETVTGQVSENDASPISSVTYEIYRKHESPQTAMLDIASGYELLARELDTIEFDDDQPALANMLISPWFVADEDQMLRNYQNNGLSASQAKIMVDFHKNQGFLTTDWVGGVFAHAVSFTADEIVLYSADASMSRGRSLFSGFGGPIMQILGGDGLPGVKSLNAVNVPEFSEVRLSETNREIYVRELGGQWYMALEQTKGRFKAQLEKNDINDRDAYTYEGKGYETYEGNIAGHVRFIVVHNRTQVVKVYTLHPWRE